MENPLKAPLEKVLKVLSTITVADHLLTSLNTKLDHAVAEAFEALANPPPEPDLDVAVEMAVNEAARVTSWEPVKHQRDFARQAIREYLKLKDVPPDDMAYCIGCGTHPKGAYTCATCSAADEYEGPRELVSDWPDRV